MDISFPHPITPTLSNCLAFHQQKVHDYPMRFPRLLDVVESYDRERLTQGHIHENEWSTTLPYRIFSL